MRARGWLLGPAGLVLAACHGSTFSPSGGAPDGGGGAGDGGVEAGAARGVLCDGTYCTADAPVCCWDAQWTGGTCRVACPSSGVAFYCSSSDDCVASGGAYCCALVNGGAYLGPSSCSQAPCPDGTTEMCDSARPRCAADAAACVPWGAQPGRAYFTCE